MITLTTQQYYANENTDQANQYVLQLQNIKNKDYALAQEFLSLMQEIFSIQVFVETGTYNGDTTATAASVFNEVHTIELSPHFAKHAAEKFRHYKHIYVHTGDSGKLLPNLLTSMQSKKILFWFDGHYSEGNTAKGVTNTPIVAELLALKESGITDSIILIDDIRCFQKFENLPPNSALSDYPTFSELKKLIQSINNTYIVTMYGDILFAFPQQSNFNVSPLVHACTISRLYEEKNMTNLEDALSAEIRIAHAQGIEKDFIQSLYHRFSNSEPHFDIGKHYRFWYSLILLQEKKFNEAILQLKKSGNLGYNQNHIDLYLHSAYDSMLLSKTK